MDNDTEPFIKFFWHLLRQSIHDMESGANHERVRHDSAGTHQLGTLGAAARTLTVPVGSLQGVVLEFVP